MPEEVRYWFPAKRYGWGWGLPVSWQGWVVYAVFFALLVGGTAVLPPHQSPGTFAVYVVIVSLTLVGVCWWKGEPPRWRWGGK